MNAGDAIKDGSFNNINNERTYYKIFEINNWYKKNISRFKKRFE